LKYHGALLCAAGHKIYKMSSLDFVILAARFRRSSAVNFLKIHPCTFLFSEFSDTYMAKIPVPRPPHREPAAVPRTNSIWPRASSRKEIERLPLDIY